MFKQLHNINCLFRYKEIQNSLIFYLFAIGLEKANLINIRLSNKYFKRLYFKYLILYLTWVKNQLY